VKIQFDPEKVKLIINDNGIGFDLTKGNEWYVHYGKTGLIGMNERSRLINGSLKFDSAPEQGTTITLEVPA
jgi:signal transduction histidine kinase